MHWTVEHLGLAALDPRRLREWYVNVLGAETVLSLNQDPPAFFLRLGGGVVIEIYQAAQSTKDTSRNSLGGWRHLALHVASLEAARDELSRRGVEFSESVKPAGGGGRILFFKDPEGNLLHLVERPEPLGAKC